MAMVYKNEEKKLYNDRGKKNKILFWKNKKYKMEVKI